MKKLIYIWFVFPLIFTGCWDRIELEEQGYVTVIGVDLGSPNMLSVTYQIPSTANFPAGGGGGSEADQGKTTVIYTFSAPEFVTGRDLATAFLSRRINFSHTRVIVISEDVAKSDEAYRAVLSSLRDREFRRHTYIIVSKEKASDFIKNNSPKLENQTYKFYDYITRRWLESGMVPISTVNEYAQRLGAKSSLFLCAYGTTEMTTSKEYGYESDYLPGEINKTGGNPIEIIGSAVFKMDKMIGVLTGEETRLALLLSNYSKANNMFVTFPDPLMTERRISARMIKEGNPKIKVNLSGEAPEIDVKIKVGLRLLAIPSKIDYPENIGNQEKLEEGFAEYMEEKAMKLVKKTQREFGGEPFQWSLAARRKFSTLQEFLDYNWMEKYPDAKVNVKFDVELLGTGKQLKPPK
jgi:spore germination protein KC